MSDIPVGSPPVPPGRHAAPGGWYPDPVDARQERYWDGWQWSRNTRVVDGPAPAPARLPVADEARHLQQDLRPGPAPGLPPNAVLTADGVRVSGWWWRVLAAIIDYLIMGLLVTIIASPIYLRLFQAFSVYAGEVWDAANAGTPPPPQPAVSDLISTTDQLLLVVITVVVDMAFIVGFLRWKRATPGKLAVGLRVVPVDHGHFTGKLSWSALIIRAGIWVLPGTTLALIVVWVADVLFPLWQPKRQALHDLAAKTQVIKIS